MQNSESELLEASKGLERIVEGIEGTMNHGTWRDDHGRRMKDTYEWVRFYNAISAQPAPADHLMVGSTNKEMLTSFGAEDIREGSRMVFGPGDDEDTWEDYYEVPFHVLDRIRAALEAKAPPPSQGEPS